MQSENLGVINTLGPALAQSLTRNIGGNASRSELDRLSEPIKKLISRFPLARTWLEAGLNDPSFPSAKISSEQKAIFIKKLTRYAAVWEHFESVLSDYVHHQWLTRHVPL